MGYRRFLASYFNKLLDDYIRNKDELQVILR